MNIGQQNIPTGDVAASVTERETAQLEPPILTIGPADAMLNFVWLARIYGMLPDSYYMRKVGRVHRLSRPPLLQFFKRAAKIIEDPAVDVFDLSLGRHDRDQTGNRFNDESKGLFIGSKSFLCSRLLSVIG